MTLTAPAPGALPGALQEQLVKRLQDVTSEARRLLGVPGGAGDLEELRSLIAVLGERLATAGSPDAAPLLEQHQAALDRLRHRFEGRFDALDRVEAAIAELRDITVPGTMLARAPAALCNASRLERAIISSVRGGLMIAEAVHFTGQGADAQEVLEQLRADPVALEHPLIETELMRRRRATIVVDAHVHARVDRRLAELMGWRSYAAAPIVGGSQVIGMIHADRGRNEPLDVLDRDVLWEFSSGLAQAYVTASLRRTLRREREQMRQFLEWLNARSGALTDAPITLAGEEQPALAPPEPLDQPPPLAGRDDRVVFEGLLTRRELDVLRLLAEGRTNKAIADALVISPGTVKFHTGSILRKLHAANRAEAVSRYLRLLGMPTP
jgi:DNA-binding CsgD family transcriptional regulator